MAGIMINGKVVGSPVVAPAQTGRSMRQSAAPAGQKGRNEGTENTEGAADDEDTPRLVSCLAMIIR